MRRHELYQLFTDHPGAARLDWDEVQRRFWAYDLERVRFARSQVHLNRIRDAIMTPVARLLDGLIGHYERKRRETE